MTDQADFLARLTAMLEGASLEWYLCGSVASTHHGVPRSTHDIDVLVRIDHAGLERLSTLIDQDRYYVSDARAALGTVSRST